MNANFGIYQVLLILGVFQGLFLAIILIISKGYQNRFLALLLSILTFSCLVTFLWESGYIIYTPHVIGIATPLLYLIGPSFWLYINSVFLGKSKWKLLLLHAIPFIICVALISPFYFESTDTKIGYINEHIYSETFSMPGIRGLYYGFFLIQFVVYLIATHRFLKKISINTYQIKEWKNWISLIQRGLEIIAGSYLLIFVLYLFTDVNTVAFRDTLFLLVTFFIHYIAYLSIAKSKIFTDPKIRYELNSYSSTDLIAYLNEIMEEKELYLNPMIKLPEIAGMLKITPQRLSEIINLELGMNFNDYINQFRVARTKELLANHKYDVFDLDGIADKSGFSGRINLSRVFKKLTGQTPTEFKRQVRTGDLRNK